MKTPEYVKRSDASFKRTMIVSVILVAIVVVGAIFSALGSSDIDEIADAWLEHIRNEEYAEAYEMLSTEYRSSVDLERFHAAMSGNAILRGNQGLSSTSDDATGGGRTLEGRIGTEADETQIGFRFVLEEGWFTKHLAIAGVELDGTSALPQEETP